jgi:hypothetical protein
MLRSVVCGSVLVPIATILAGNSRAAVDPTPKALSIATTPSHPRQPPDNAAATAAAAVPAAAAAWSANATIVVAAGQSKLIGGTNLTRPYNPAFGFSAGMELCGCTLIHSDVVLTGSLLLLLLLLFYFELVLYVY